MPKRSSFPTLSAAEFAADDLLPVLKKNADGTYSDRTLPKSALPAGEANTASNVGTAGVGLFKEKSGAELRFKKLKAGANVTITATAADEVEVAASGGTSGEANTASNVGGAGLGVFKQKTGADLEFKKLTAGANVTVTELSSGEIEIAASGGASGDAYSPANLAPLRTLPPRTERSEHGAAVNAHGSNFSFVAYTLMDDAFALSTVRFGAGTALAAASYLLEVWSADASYARGTKLVSVSGSSFLTVDGHNFVAFGLPSTLSLAASARYVVEVKNTSSSNAQPRALVQKSSPLDLGAVRLEKQERLLSGAYFDGNGVFAWEFVEAGGKAKGVTGALDPSDLRLPRGPTSSRPATADLSSNETLLYFDTTLAKLIVWSGSAWADALGGAV